MNKQALRRQYLQLRDGLSAPWRAVWSAQIEAQLFRFVAEGGFSVILAYAAFRSEPETAEVLRRLLEAGKTVALPKCRKNGEMEAYRLREMSELSPGAYGILEPPEREPLSPEALDLVLVPGCAFGRDMSRLGYGGGYYDRYLPACSRAVRAGICFEACLTDSLPRESHDLTVDYIITENGVMNNL